MAPGFAYFLSSVLGIAMAIAAITAAWSLIGALGGFNGPDGDELQRDARIRVVVAAAIALVLYPVVGFLEDASAGYEPSSGSSGRPCAGIPQEALDDCRRQQYGVDP